MLISLGFQQAFDQTGSIPIAFAMSILRGIGGGLIRDAITSQPPQALSDPVYPCMMAAGAAGSLLIWNCSTSPWTLSVALVLTVAVISVLTRERLPAMVAEEPITPALPTLHKIAIVRKELQQQIAIFQAVLSDIDIDFAEGQFWKLQRAIEPWVSPRGCSCNLYRFEQVETFYGPSHTAC